jgi:hypothetical protein
MRIWPPSPCQVVDTNKERIARKKEWKNQEYRRRGVLRPVVAIAVVTTFVATE